MQSQNEPGANGESRREELRRGESHHGESAAGNSSGAQSDRRRNAQPWGVPFVLFLPGFMLLVALGKLKISRLTADLVRGLAAGPCVAAFVIAHRAQRAAR